MKAIIVRSLTVVALLCATSPAWAVLASFEYTDGYYVTSPGWVDVTYYDAGQFGTTWGGSGTPTPIAPDSGLWSLKSQVGAFYPTTAGRNAVVGSAPPYPAPSSAGTIPAYIVGNHNPGRTGVGALALRNDNASVGAMDYDYRFDSDDFGGINPSTVTSGLVDIEFYFCPNAPDIGNPGQGLPSSDKFIMSFKDSGGNIGFQLGYQNTNDVVWRSGSSGSWTTTGIVADHANWDGFRARLDLTNDTFGLRYFDVSTSSVITLAPVGTPMGAAMADATHLGWWLSDFTNASAIHPGGKNFFDDFTVRSAVPEPSSVVLAVVATAGSLWTAVRRRRKPVVVG
jgi:hypothetical protein